MLLHCLQTKGPRLHLRRSTNSATIYRLFQKIQQY